MSTGVHCTSGMCALAEAGERRTHPVKKQRTTQYSTFHYTALLHYTNNEQETMRIEVAVAYFHTASPYPGAGTE